MATKKKQTVDDMKRTMMSFVKAHNSAPEIAFAELEEEARVLASETPTDDPRRKEVDAILLAMKFARGHLAKGDAWWAAYELARAMRKAERLRFKSLLPLLEIGDRVRAGGKKGAEVANGRIHDRGAFMRAIDEVRQRHPDWGITKVREEVAKKLGVNPRTVIRRTKAQAL